LDQKGDVFDRLTKKRTLEQRFDKDLDSLIKEEGHKGVPIKSHDIHKRIKKAELPKKQEEVKVDPSCTIIDLSQHKNNIRQREPEIQAAEEGQEEKKKIRCRHWPNCNYSDEECQYFHPKEECPYFPKC